jgi:hypothetical protein
MKTPEFSPPVSDILQRVRKTRLFVVGAPIAVTMYRAGDVLQSFPSVIDHTPEVTYHAFVSSPAAEKSSKKSNVALPLLSLMADPLP